LKELSAAQVTGFVIDEVSRRRTWSAKSLVTALRFMHVSGHVPVGLAAAAPAVAGLGLRSLPRGIGSDQVAAMLAGCDRRTPLGASHASRASAPGMPPDQALLRIQGR